MAATYNLFIDQGTTFRSNVTVKDSTNTIRDITNYTARSQFRKSFYSANSYSFTTAIDGINGNVQLSLSAATSSNVTPGRYVYDTEIVNNSSGDVERVAEGIIILNPEVTR